MKEQAAIKLEIKIHLKEANTNYWTSSNFIFRDLKTAVSSSLTLEEIEELKAFGEKVAKRIELKRKECDEKGRARRAEQGLDG